MRRYTIHYYQITLHRSSAPILTYHHDKPLKKGQQIEVPVHSKVKLAMVLDEVEKPEGFETSAIVSVLDYFYSEQQIVIAKFIS
ncbi:MAG: primosomal protein N', partial [Sulfurovaceae bacterium]|nr:primosomal protein N' [Sulfurovaceae bacterium]